MTTDSVYPEALEALIAGFRRLPGVGRRSAERFAIALLEWRDEELTQFGSDLAALRKRVRFCEQCGNLTETAVCRICSELGRDRGLLCVVEQATQVAVFEKTRCYHGLYHVLGGRIMPLEGKGPEDLRIAALHGRLQEGGIRELILATGSDVEGEATANFLAAECEQYPVRVTRLAAGIPVGADLSFADSATLTMAIAGRRPLSSLEEQ